MRKLLWLAIVIQLSFSVCASAQSLADAARKERERQRRVHSGAVTITGATAAILAGNASNAGSVPPPGAGGKTNRPLPNKRPPAKDWPGATFKSPPVRLK